VAQARQAVVWTLAEVVERRVNGGHVSLEVFKRDAPLPVYLLMTTDMRL